MIHSGHMHEVNLIKDIGGSGRVEGDLYCGNTNHFQTDIDNPVL